MSSGELRATTFLFTAVSVGCLTEAVTRFVSLMRCTPSVVFCAIIGIVTLAMLIMHMGLLED